MTLSPALYSEVLAHIRGALPAEAVGIFGGKATGEVMVVLPLTNIAPGNRRFLADPFEQFCALGRLKADNQVLLAIYHSHPDGGVVPSNDDLDYAKRWPCVHVIVALSTAADYKARFRGFRLDTQGCLDEVPLRLPER